MSNPLQFSVDFASSNASRRRTPDQPMRILFLTDLGDTCQTRASKPIETRPFRLVDIDALDTLLEDEKPVAHLPAGDISPEEIDDFDADQICKSLPIFQTLKSIRRRLSDPSTFEAAAQEVRSMLQIDDTSPSTNTPSDETDTDTLSRLFGASSDPTEPSAAPSNSGGFLGNLLHDAVSSHIVADANPGADQYIKAVDAAAEAHLRAALHDPSFQSLEAAWRGLDQLISNIETDEDLSIHVWNVAKSELLDAMGAKEDPLEQSILHRRLVEKREDSPFTLIVSDITFGETPEDLRLLATLGALAGRTDALVLAGIAPNVIGASSWHDIANAPEAIGDADLGWTAIRESALGGHIATFAPGFLLRTPYGKKLDPLDAFFEFEEIENPAEAQSPFLWGAPAILATILIAQSFRQNGWNAQLNTNLTYDDLPLVSFEADGVPQMKPCAETLFSERVAEVILKSGPVPLVAIRNQNAVRLPWFQTISESGTGGKLGPFNT